jgi:hypothetical protein
MAELVRSYDAGRVVPPGDDAALAETLQALCDDPYARRLLGARAHALGQSFTWETAVQPLLAFCHAPHKGTRVSGFTTAELQERITELESRLYQTSTYAERLERELAARGGPDLTAPAHMDRGVSARFRRALQGLRRGASGPSGTESEPPPSS